MVKNIFTLSVGIVLLVLTYSAVFCQVSDSATRRYQSVKVGDKVPEYKLINLINYTAKTAKISDFKGKLVILDFWSSFCGSCIDAFPKLEALQKEFGNKIQIIMINAIEDESTVRKLFAQRKKLANIDMRLPCVCKDTAIQQLFYYSGLPHEVWLDENGYVTSITEISGVNTKNITALLNHEKITISQKINTADLIRVKWAKPLFIDGNGGRPEKIFWQSTFAKADNRIFPSIVIVAEKKRNEFYITCTKSSILDMYRLAYSNVYWSFIPSLNILPKGRVLLEVKDTTRYVDIVEGEYNDDNLFTYQLITPPNTEEGLQKLMQEDLKKYVGLEARWEKRKLKCFVLKAYDTLLISYKKGETKQWIDGFIIKLNNVPVRFFIARLLEDRYYYTSYPIIDETSYAGNLGDIDFEADVNDYKSLNKALQKYKMGFTLENREVEVLVLTEPNY